MKKLVLIFLIVIVSCSSDDTIIKKCDCKITKVFRTWIKKNGVQKKHDVILNVKPYSENCNDYGLVFKVNNKHIVENVTYERK